MYNKLQWVDGPEKDGVVTEVLAPELEERSKPGAGLWLHALTRLHESQALVRLYAGHTDAVFAVGYSPNGTRVVSGSQDNTTVHPPATRVIASMMGAPPLTHLHSPAVPRRMPFRVPLQFPPRLRQLSPDHGSDHPSRRALCDSCSPTSPTD